METTLVITGMTSTFSYIRTSRLARLVLGAVSVLIIALSYSYWSSAGLRELDLAIPLVANAKSWHVTHTSGPLRVEEDVVCPFDYDATTTINQQDAREVHVGHIYYTQQSTGEWSSRPGNEFGHCSGGPQINNLGLAVNLRRIRESGRISRGPSKAIAGRTCRVWNLLNPVPGSRPEPVATLCIDEESHLPVELASVQETYQFSNWNSVPAIQPPQIGSSLGQGMAAPDSSAAQSDSGTSGR